MADLTTLANVKQYLGLTATSDDALLSRLITAASSWVRTYCNRDFTSQSYTDTLDGTGNAWQVMKQYPVTAVASVSFSGVAQAITGLVITNTRSLTFTDGTLWEKGRGNVSVTYAAGYSTTPADIEQAVIEIVALRYREKNRIGTTTVNTRGESVTFSVMDVPPSVKSLLNNYRNVVPV